MSDKPGSQAYTVRLERLVDGMCRLIISPRPSSERDGDRCSPNARLQHAAEWAMELDSQYRELLRAGHSVQVSIPPTLEWSVRRVHRETVAEYRMLRLGVGELIFPLLLAPPNLDELYPFQREGVRWLIGRTGGILADEMGLGKTVQVIGAIRLLFNRAKIRSVLIVCPKSLVANWEREFTRWAPELGIGVVTPTARIRTDAWKAVLGRFHVLLTNYEQLREVPRTFTRTPLDLIVADEAHRLRNRWARVTSGSFRLEPRQFWALTGTPLERDLEDLATLLALVAPTSFAPNDAKLHASSLRSRARPYILRRRKKLVLKELPVVQDSTEILELSEAQKSSYRAALRRHRKAGAKANELSLLTRLLMLCDIDTESRESCKVDRILNLLGRIHEQREKAVIFSYRLEPLRQLKCRIADQWGSDSALMLVGEMDRDERDQAVTKFRNDNKALALLASSRVGGEGLTLVEANHVFLFNQWWNPSANDQARDRVVRIGQRRKVRIYRFCCCGTIEEDLERILKSKQGLIHSTVERLAQGERSAWPQIVREIGAKSLLYETTE